MKIDVPVKNTEGEYQFTATLNDKEIQAVLQFGMNMALAMGITSQVLGQPDESEEEERQAQLDFLAMVDITGDKPS